MSFTDLRKVTTISSVSSLTTVTVNGQSGQVYKVACNNLEKCILPSPDSGASFQGMAKVIDSNGNVGAFIMVGANPTASAAGSFAAREAWIIPASAAFLQAEYGTSQAADLQAITVPSSGNTIAFDSITGAAPQTANSITPPGFGGGCVSATLRGHRLDDAEDLGKLLGRINSITGLDLTKLLASDYSILSGSLLSWSSGMQISISAGSARFKGIEYSHAGGTLSGFTDKQLTRALVDASGNYQISLENSSGGTLDSDYNPSGTSPAPTAVLPTAASPVWSASGTASAEAVANGVLGLSVSANTRIYTRSGVTGPPASGSTLSAWLQYVSGSGFQCEVDHGGGNSKDGFTVGNGFVLLNSTGQKFYFDTTKPFHARLTLQNAVSNLYINGYLALTSSAAQAGSSNQVRWGFLTSSTGSMNIGRLIFRSAITLVPTWQSSTGAVIGTVATMTSTFASPVGLIGQTPDLALNARKENNLLNRSEIKNLIQKIQAAALSITATKDDNVIFCDATAGNMTVTLPAASSVAGQWLTIIKTDNSTNTVTISGTINGAANPALAAQYDKLAIISDGNSWFVESGLNTSEVWVTGGNGMGSTNTKIRRFTTISKNVGSGITYADSAANGGSFTINEDGLYQISYTDYTTGAYFGISVNSAQLTTNIESITAANRLNCQNSNNTSINTSFTTRLAKNDVIRAHTAGAFNDTFAALVHLRITKIGT